MIINFIYLTLSIFLNGCGNSFKMNATIKKKHNWEEVDSEGLKKFQETGEPYLLMFYADWCGYCNQTKPIYKKASSKCETPFFLLNEKSNGAREIIEREGIRGYPTCKKYRGKKMIAEYNGPRTVEGFVEFGNSKDKQINHKCIDIDSEGLKEYEKNNEPYIILFYADWCGHCQEIKPKYQQASNNCETHFLILNQNANGASEIMKRENIQGFPTIKKFMGRKMIEEYSGPRTVEGIVAFAKSK